MAAVMVPFVAVTMAVAGALLAAMAVATVSGETEALARGVAVLLFGVLGKAPVAALAAAVLAGGVTYFFDRDSVIASAAAAGLLVFCGVALYATVLTALEISAAGCWVGAGLGAVLGVVAGVAVVMDDRSPKMLRRAAGRRTSARGAHPGELEWWRGDLDGLDDDGD